MIHGVPIPPIAMIVGGIILLSLLVFQISVGMRWLKLGRKSFVYHKWVAFTILGVAAVHAVLGILFVTGASLF